MDVSVYSRPNKPKKLIVNQRQRVDTPPLDVKPVVEVDRSTECHVTPPNIAARMADYLGLDEKGTVLDPQVGTGNLIQALIDLGYRSDQIKGVERNYQLADVSNSRFNSNVDIEQHCFLDFAAQNKGLVSFDRIITNPPFKYVKKHMQAALDLLAPDGAIIALVPVTYQNAKATELEILDVDTFQNAKVHTKLIEIDLACW